MAIDMLDKTAIGSHTTQVVEKPWDGAANVARLSSPEQPAYFSRIFAWRDGGEDPKVKSNYRFPHHEVATNGDVGSANVAGLRAGIAALNGARGGTTIPQADRRGVWRHLVKHLRDWNPEVEVPELAARSWMDEVGFDGSSEYVEVGSKAFIPTLKDVDTSVGFFVKGFASLEGIDRDGDDISASAFDIETFMGTHQLWLNHQLFKRPKDGMNVPIGTIEAMHVVKIQQREDGGFDVTDEKTGDLLDTFEDDDKFVHMKSKDRGLWVIAKVMEPEIIELVKDGRLNAFSWSGVIFRQPNGRIHKIDMREVSLVFLPANARALFIVGKGSLKATTDFIISKDGLVYPIEDDVVYKLAREGAAFRFMSMSAEGVSLFSPVDDVTTLDNAKELADKIAEDTHIVLVFKNQWQQTPSGEQVYRIIYRADGEAFSTTPQTNVVVDTNEFTPWEKAYVDDLPDDCFAYIAKGGVQDSEGKTNPRALRHAPYKTHNGNVDTDAVMYGIKHARSTPYSMSILTQLISVAKEHDLGDWLESNRSAALTERELQLYGIRAEFPIKETSTKGGDDMANAEEVLAKLEEFSVDLSGKIEKISARIDLFETKKQEDTSTESKDKEDEKKSKDTDAESKSDEVKEDVTEEDNALKKLFETVVSSITALTSKVDTLSGRLSKLEDTPSTSQTLKDDEAKQADSLQEPDLKDVVKKALSEVSPEVQKHAKKVALSNVLGFSEIPERHQNMQDIV